MLRRYQGRMRGREAENGGKNPSDAHWWSSQWQAKAAPQVFKIPCGVRPSGKAVIPRWFTAGVFASVPQGILVPDWAFTPLCFKSVNTSEHIISAKERGVGSDGMGLVGEEWCGSNARGLQTGKRKREGWWEERQVGRHHLCGQHGSHQSPSFSTGPAGYIL